MTVRISLLGSTGSIGRSTLEVVGRFPDRYSVVGLAAGSDVERMAAQAEAFRPHTVSLADGQAADELQKRIGTRAAVCSGAEGASCVATLEAADIVVAAISGSAGLRPTYDAVCAGKDIALANKESLVMAGALINRIAGENGSRIVPVDSEHSAIYQLMQGHDQKEVRSIILTASGGPFLNTPAEELHNVSPAQALRHPRWDMGRKVTIDSATLMNKGLEIIEAHWLFGLTPDRIRVVVHPQSIIHSMVEFLDGSIFAQLSVPDMKGPIAYALSVPERLENIMEPLSFADSSKLTFEAPDTKRFPCLELAYEALREGGLMPVAMNGANEIAVEEFLNGRIGFQSIPLLIERVMERFETTEAESIEHIIDIDTWARSTARELRAAV